jgi:hypothetical protein
MLSRIGALPNRIMRSDTKLSFMFDVVDSRSGKQRRRSERVHDDHSLTGRMVEFERGVCRDAFLRYGESWFTRRAGYRWIPDAPQSLIAAGPTFADR